MRYKKKINDVYIAKNKSMFHVNTVFLNYFLDTPPNEATLSGLTIFANPNDGGERNSEI